MGREGHLTSEADREAGTLAAIAQIMRTPYCHEIPAECSISDAPPAAVSGCERSGSLPTRAMVQEDAADDFADAQQEAVLVRLFES